MKSVKHFLHSFGTSGRVPEGCKFPGGDDVLEGTALPDSRPDILTSVKKECVQRKPSSEEPRPPDIRMATNANGNLFPVICNVRTKETKTWRTGDSGVPARANGLRTFRRCVPLPNNRSLAGQHQGTATSGLPVIRPSMTLRVSSVPSKPPETEATTRSLLPTSTAATLTRRRTKCEKPEAKNVGLTDDTSKRDHTSTIGADERNGRSDDGAGKRWFKGDHNTNGLPLYEVPPQTRIPRLGASSSGVPTRTQNAVALRPVGLRRSTSDISQNACSNGNLLKVGTTPGGCIIEAPSKVTANTTDSGIGSVLVAKTQAVKKSEEEEASTSDADGETTMTTPNGKKKNGNVEAPSKACGNKPKSKSRCQRRIWSFSLPRFMRSHSSPKLNSDLLPSEESRSSTLPRLKTSEDGDSGSSNNGGHLFKVTSLTSLHDLPGQAPKSCLSQGDVSIAGDYPPSSAVKSQVSDQEEQRQSPAGSAGSPHGAKVFAVTGSRSSSDNGTDNGTTERPYIMPPRALRKYIKTNFRRLNVPEGTATESEKAQLDGQQPSGPAADALSSKTDLPTKTCTVKASAAEAPNGFPLLALKSESDKERAPTGPSEAGKHVPHAAADITEGVIGDHGASVTGENNKESTQKGVVALKSEKLPFGPCLDSNHKLFTEEVDIHRAVPATVRLVHSNDTGVVPTDSSVCDDKISKRNSICVEISEDGKVKFEGNTSAAEMTPVQSEDAASHGSDLDQRTQTPDEVTVVHDAAPGEVLGNGADVPAGLERQVDGASCSESLSSFESEMTLAEKLGKRIQSTSRKLRVLDRPTLNSGTLRKPGGSFQVVVGSSSSAGTRKGKKYSCERIRQLESDVWLAERELLLLKEKLLRNHGRHSSRPPDKSKSGRDKPEHPKPNSPLNEHESRTSPNGQGAEAEETRRVLEENMLLQQELKEKCDLLSKLEEELDQRDDAAGLEGLDRITSLPVNRRTQQQREELRVTKEALSSLRQCFRLDDPYQHTLDTIEQSLCTLLERVTSMERQAAGGPAGRDGGRRLNFDSTGDPRRLPITTLEEFPVQRLDPLQSLGRAQASTKVIYYTEKSVTPFLSVIPRRLGDITLRDFKVAFDRPGLYRFHFKTLDPEFGMVKEEVLHDDDIIPGWDGKIVAWIEEDI